MRESVIPRTTSEAPQSRCSTSADAESNCYTLVHCQGQYQVQVSQPLYFVMPNILLLTNGIARVLLTTLRADGLRHLCVQIESLSLPEDQFEGTRTICLKPCIIDGLPREGPDTKYWLPYCESRSEPQRMWSARHTEE